MNERRALNQSRVAPTLAQVRRELVDLLSQAGETDLGTLYRRMMAIHGTQAAPLVGESIGMLVRQRAVTVETRPAGPEGPLIGWIQLVQREAPRYSDFAAA